MYNRCGWILARYHTLLAARGSRQPGPFRPCRTRWIGGLVESLQLRPSVEGTSSGGTRQDVTCAYRSTRRGTCLGFLRTASQSDGLKHKRHSYAGCRKSSDLICASDVQGQNIARDSNGQLRMTVPTPRPNGCLCLVCILLYWNLQVQSIPQVTNRQIFAVKLSMNGSEKEPLQSYRF